MDQEKQAAIFRLADDARQIQVIPSFIPDNPLKTINDTCCDELFPKVDTLVEPEDLTFAKILTVLGFLAPHGKGAIPRELVNECRRIMEIYKKGILNDEIIVDVGWALAAGWQRKPILGDSVWDAPWAFSVAHLIAIAESMTYHLLSRFACESIHGSPRNFDMPEHTEIKAWATLMVMQFVGLQLDSSKKKEQYRRLATWEPGLRKKKNKSSLISWLTRALFGTPETFNKVEANWFRNGLLFDVMTEEGVAKIEPVAFHLCLGCGSRDKELGEANCECKIRLDPPSYYVVDKDLLVVPGVYKGMNFWRFVPKKLPDTVKDFIKTEKRKAKGTARPVYYFDGLPECPHEADSISQRPTILFARSWLFSDPDVALSEIHSSEADDGRFRIEVVDSTDLVEDVARREQQEQLQEVINNLPENMKYVLVMVMIDGKSVSNVASEIDLPVWRVQELLEEALDNLRDQFGSGCS